MSVVDRRQSFAATAAAPAAGFTPRGSAEERTYSEGAARYLSEQPVLKIATGRILGIERGGVRSFKAIPCGASTAGENRFRRPQPPAPWSGERGPKLST